MEAKVSKVRALEVLRAALTESKRAIEAEEEAIPGANAMHAKTMDAIYDAVIFGGLTMTAAGKEFSHTPEWIKTRIGRTGDRRYRKTPQFLRDKRAYLKKLG
jgi:hypothetical protein